MTLAITGANGSVGQNLLSHLAERGDTDVVACVRSDRAAASLPRSPRLAVRVASYDDVAGLAEALSGASSVVHLAGILIEWKGSDYERANVGTTLALVEAARAAGVEHVVLVSVIGASVASSNRYFSSKGEAERAVAASGISATIIRTPILLGPGTAGAASLVRTVGRGKARLLGGGRYTMRPLDVDDLSEAILGACRSRPQGVTTYELAGPEPVSYRTLLERAATVAGRPVSFGATPIWLAKLAAEVMSTLKGGGLSPTVIDVITADEVVPENADRALGITLTPLSETLRKFLPDEARAT
jgi:uncharacterized protein YbjT (DUF2867 family)